MGTGGKTVKINLRQTLRLAQQALEDADIDYALIGGLALANLGIHRATVDVDLLVDGQKKDIAKQVLQKMGFELTIETEEVLQFSGIGLLDLLLANREPTQNMLKRAWKIKQTNLKCLTPEDIIGLKIQAYSNDPRREFQDKADIVSLIENYPDLDWQRVKDYASLFDQWPEIERLRSKQ